LHPNNGFRFALLATGLAFLFFFNAHGVERSELTETLSLINPLNSSQGKTELKAIDLSTTQEANTTDNGFCVTPVYPHFVEDLYRFPHDIEVYAHMSALTHPRPLRHTERL